MRLRICVPAPILDGLSDQPVRNFCRLLDLDLTVDVSGESLQAGAVLDDAQEFFRQNGVNVRLDFLRGNVTTAYLVIAQGIVVKSSEGAIFRNVQTDIQQKIAKSIAKPDRKSTRLNSSH